MARRRKGANSEPVDATLKPDWNYEAKVAEVERIIAQIEGGELELEEVFEQFTAAFENIYVNAKLFSNSDSSKSIY
jgi:exodeoxyribonuclease VII small subunit